MCVFYCCARTRKSRIIYIKNRAKWDPNRNEAQHNHEGSSNVEILFFFLYFLFVLCFFFCCCCCFFSLFSVHFFRNFFTARQNSWQTQMVLFYSYISVIKPAFSTHRKRRERKKHTLYLLQISNLFQFICFYVNIWRLWFAFVVCLWAVIQNIAKRSVYDSVRSGKRDSLVEYLWVFTAFTSVKYPNENFLKWKLLPFDTRPKIAGNCFSIHRYCIKMLMQRKI